tara:strand:- start:1320 stop:1640 length:321 start_codon:yes stop_codon:yes gene_type:complete
MIAFVGHDHPRLFERQYINCDADLYVFRNKPYNSINMKYKKKGTEKKFFENSDYQSMLLVYQLRLEFRIEKERPTVYIHENQTVAEYFVQKWVHSSAGEQNREIYI